MGLAQQSELTAMISRASVEREVAPLRARPDSALGVMRKWRLGRSPLAWLFGGLDAEGHELGGACVCARGHDAHDSVALRATHGESGMRQLCERRAASTTWTID